MTATSLGASSTARRRPSRAALALVALAIALASSWLAPLAGIGSASPAFAAATDLTLVTDTVYTVQPAQRRIRVTMTVTARNNTRETKARRFYFDHAFLAVLPTASDVHGTGARVKVQKRTKDAALLRIDFGSRLYSGKSRSFRVSFDLVDRGTPADRAIRVGPTLVTMPVWAHASNGARGSTVTVRVPAGYDVAVERGRFDATKKGPGGATELTTKGLAKPLDFFAYLSAQKPATYTEQPLDVTAGDESIALRLRPWTEDAAWADRVGGLFTRSLPVLRREIGLPWPRTEPMAVEEGVSRSANGYAGLFDPAENRVEVAYWADHLVVIHEAAHGWFNGSLLADRWANEGFASLYAERAAAEIKETGASPKLTDAAKAAAFPLNAWAVQPVPAPDTDASRTTEAYGYAASLSLANAIAERAGDDALRAAWADIAGHVGAYQPGDENLTTPPSGSASDGTPETVDGAADWRGLLDVLERRTGKDFTDLWRQWVVRPEETGLLDARATARASYERTLALADGWALPRAIRDAMRAWQFDVADQLMADARTVLAQRAAIETMATQDGLSLPEDMQGLFEAGQLVDASGRAEAERNAMLTIAGAAGAKSSERDPLISIGMLGENPDANISAARSSLAAGDIDAALSSADDAFRAWNGAWQEGRRRALLAVAVLATLIVLASAVVGRVRRARREDAALAVAAAGSDLGGPPAGSTPATRPTRTVEADDREPTAEELLAAGSPRLPDADPRLPAQEADAPAVTGGDRPAAPEVEGPPATEVDPPAATDGDDR